MFPIPHLFMSPIALRRTRRATASWGRPLLLAIAVAVAGWTGPSPAAAQSAVPREVSTPQGSIELIAATGTPSASGEIWLGLRLHLEPGWHTYWRNPGDSGGPPTVRWTLPAGVSAEPFIWPAPERIAVGPLVNYGYHGDVVLPVRLSLPSASSGTAPLRVEADVRWLVCKELCAPVRSKVALDVAVVAKDQGRAAEWSRRIAAARASAPRSAPSTWKASASVTADRSEFVLTVLTDRAVSSAIFFPLEESQVDDAAPQTVTAQGRELRIRLKTSDQLRSTPAVLRGVIVLPSGAAFDITAPVHPPAAPAASRPIRRS